MPRGPKPGQREKAPYLKFESEDKLACDPQWLRDAGIVMCGRAVENGIPLPVVGEVLEMLSIKEAPPEPEEDHREIETALTGSRHFTKAQSMAIMAKVAPDKELAERYGRTVDSIVQHRAHVNRRAGEKRRYAPE
jgi:hypothetical protein